MSASWRLDILYFSFHSWSFCRPQNLLFPLFTLTSCSTEILYELIKQSIRKTDDLWSENWDWNHLRSKATEKNQPPWETCSRSCSPASLASGKCAFWWSVGKWYLLQYESLLAMWTYDVDLLLQTKSWFFFMKHLSHGCNFILNDASPSPFLPALLFTRWGWMPPVRLRSCTNWNWVRLWRRFRRSDSTWKR